jgi:hypothetical protein
LILQWFLAFNDLLAITLGFALSGIVIFFLYFFGFINQSGDSDIETEVDVDTDLDLDSELNTEFEAEIDSDIDSELDTEVDTDLDTEIESDFETDAEIENEGFSQFTEDSTGSLTVENVETKGSGSLMVQVAAFCLVFGLTGFSVLISIGPGNNSVTDLITMIDVGFGAVLFLGLFSYLVSKKALQTLTTGNINPVIGIKTGMEIIVISENIDLFNQGRIIINSPDGGIKAMAIGYDDYDYFVQGDRGYVKETGHPIKITRSLSRRLNEMRKIKKIQA